MKIHYKTIILDKKNDLISKKILEKNRKRLIDYCCEDVEMAIKYDAIEIYGNELHILERGYEVATFYPAIKYCPFCGEFVEQIEEYKAKIERHSVHVPKKVETTPAHTEMRNREVRL